MLRNNTVRVFCLLLIIAELPVVFGSLFYFDLLSEEGGLHYLFGGDYCNII